MSDVGASPGHVAAPHATARSVARAAAWRRVAAAGVAALVLLSVAWEWQLAPLRPGGSLLVLKALPLALVWPGLARGRLRSFQLGSMLILAYAAEGIVRGMTDAAAPSRLLGWIELALATTAFVAMLAHVRSRRAGTAASRPTMEQA